MKKIILLLIGLAGVIGVSAQTIGRKAISAGGGTLTNGNTQVTYNIGEIFNASLSSGPVLLTQGFEQPGEQIKTGTIASPLCANSTVSIAFTTADIGGNNVYTAQLSNVNGSFASPVNIGTLSGNATTCSINAVIPLNTLPGNVYRIRVIGSNPPVKGTDNGINLTIHTPPTIVCPGNIIVNTTPGLCNAAVNYSTVVTGSPAPVVTYVFSGATNGSGSGNGSGSLFTRGITTVTVTATNHCDTKTCSFTVTVKDDQNATDYIIYAREQVEFGENNYIAGDVGVTDVGGEAQFSKYDVLDPFKVRAFSIETQQPSSVNNRIYSAASNGPAPVFKPYNGNSSGLTNIVISNNSTLNGNWKDVRVKKGVAAVINGNNFGKISLEEGATVTFTAGEINMEELDLQSGKAGVSTTNVVFAGPAYVRVRDKVDIENDNRVNVNGPKVTFYLGSSEEAEGSFYVRGENTQVTVNVMMPNGGMEVGGGKLNRTTVMTGWYIIDKLASSGKYIYWNRYNCGSVEVPSFTQLNQTDIKETLKESVIAPSPTVNDKFDVKLYPNPVINGNRFNLVVSSQSLEPVRVRVLDLKGEVILYIPVMLKNSNVDMGSNFIGGTYFVEVKQGVNRKIVKLIKLD